MVVAKTVLERDYTDEEIEENLGDVDFANDFAQELWKTMDELKIEAQKVSDDCLQTKHRLDAALSGINKYFGEELEGLTQLAEMSNEQLGNEYNTLSDNCSAYFEDISAFVARVQNGFINNVIETIQKSKNLLLLHNKDAFSDLKIELMSILDAARDVQLNIESAQYRLGNQPHKINRYIGKKALWYYHLKYAAKGIDNCNKDKAEVAATMKILTDRYENFYKSSLPSLM